MQKKLNNFIFQKKIDKHYFWPTVPIFGQIIVTNFEGRVISRFQATLVSEARIDKCMVQVHYEAIHTLYHSDSEINY